MKALVTHELAPSQAPRRGFVPLAVDFVQAKFIVIPLVFAAVLLVLGLLPYLGNLRGISPLLPLQHLGIRLSAIGNDRSLFSDWNTEALAFLASSIFCSIVYLFFTRFSGMAEKPGRFFGAGPIAATMILWPLSIRLGLLALVVAPITALHKPFESALVIGVLLLTGAYRLGLRSKIAGAVLARLGTAARVLISTALVAALFLVHLTLGMALLWLAAFFWVNRADSLPGVSRLPYSRWIFRNAILSTLFPLLLLPEFMESYNAYVRSRDDVRWIEQFEDQRVSENVYDIVATDAGAKVISATNEGFVLYKYSRWTGDYVRSKTIDTSSEIQTLDYFPSSGRVFAAGFDNDRAELAVFNSDFSEPTFIPVPGCRGAIQTRYRPIDDSVLITCEFSNSVVIHDLATGGQRTLNLPGWPHAAALSPDNRHLLVTSLTGLTPTLQINLDDATIEPSPTLLPGMVLGASDTLVRDLWVLTGFTAGRVFLLDGKSLRLLKNINTHLGARRATVDPTKGVVYVGNYFTGSIGVLDMETMEMTYLYAGPKVRGVYYEQNTGRLYFASKRGIGYFDMAEADPFPPILSSFDFLVSMRRGGLASMREFLGFYTPVFVKDKPRVWNQAANS